MQEYAYGGIVFNDEGKILMRSPSGTLSESPEIILLYKPERLKIIFKRGFNDE